LVCVCARVHIVRVAADRVRVIGPAAPVRVTSFRDNKLLVSFFLRCFSSNQIASNSSRDRDDCDECDDCDTSPQPPLLLELPVQLFPDADDEVAL
jgi:hypothetical protein